MAIIVPDEVVLKAECTRLGIEGSSFEELCRNHEVKKMLMQVMEKVAKNNNFMGYERAKNIYVSSELFSPDNVLTPTFKMRRQIAAKYFREKLDELYSSPNL